MQSTFVTHQNTVETSQRSPVLFYGLVVLDAFVLGGCLALMLMHNLLVTIMARLVSAAAQGEILNVLDHMLPYLFVYWGIALGLTVVTAFAIRARTNSWRIAMLPVVTFVVIGLMAFL